MCPEKGSRAGEGSGARGQDQEPRGDWSLLADNVIEQEERASHLAGEVWVGYEEECLPRQGCQAPAHVPDTHPSLLHTQHTEQPCSQYGATAAAFRH